MTNLIAQKIAEHKATGKGGIVSICSAQRDVIRAAADIATDYDAVLLIESTSNQVDQFGGYTGQTPAQYIAATREFIQSLGFPQEKVVFGGDHLGPNAWQHLPAQEAMANADELVRQYAAAGYEKIHLDCSMSCADDPVPLDDETVATRAARLCKIAEAAKTKEVVYIIGTEVPVPGGAQEDLAVHGVTPTTPEAAKQTYAVHERIFAENGLADVWPRVVGLVVQPGVEFDHHQVVNYQPEQARALSAVATTLPHALFEAHSTDYQTAAAFKALVQDHFAILKVGPALTFAYREALFALNDILAAMGAAKEDLREVIEQVMLAQPDKWKKYYQGNDNELKILRFYSLSDRIRYYWPNDTIDAAVAYLRQHFDEVAPPYSVVHQYLPTAADDCRACGDKLTAENLIRHHIRAALAPYYNAC